MKLSVRQKVGAVVSGAVNTAINKTFGISQFAQMWLTGMDMPDSTSGKATKPYKQVGLVFTCIEKLIAAIQGLPPVMSTIDDKVVEGGPQYDLLFNNPAMSFQRFVTESIGHYALGRDVFWVFTEMAGTVPKEVIVVAGSQMSPVTHNRTAGGVLLGWEFRGLGGQREKYGINEVCQWKNFNPYDKFHGIGPAQAARNDLDYSFAASLLNASALDNGADLGTILTTQGTLTPEQINLLRSQFESRHRGAGNAKRTAILTGGMDVKTSARSMVEMEVAKISEMTDKKICSAWGVPPGVAGLITEAQYSHGPAMEDFVFNTIIPFARLFAGEVNAGILSKTYTRDARSVEMAESKMFRGRSAQLLAKNPDLRAARQKAVTARQGVFLWLDTTEHPVVQRVQRETSEKVLKFTDAGIPLNDLIKKHDLPYEPVDWGNEWWINMGRVPASYVLEAGIEGITGPSLPEGEPAELGFEASVEKLSAQIAELAESKKTTKADEDQRLRIWQSWTASWLGIAREFEGAMRVYFVRQQRILEKKLKDAMTELAGKSTKDAADNIIARVVFDMQTENGKIKVINQVFFGKASELGIRQTLSEVLGLTEDELAQQAETARRMAWLRGKRAISTIKITGVNKTTQDAVARQLRRGLDAGEGLNDLTGRIKTTLGSNRARALRIARTQTGGAVSTGRHAGMQSANVERKSWLTSRDKDVRDSHRAAESRYTEGIPLDQPFEVGGQMLMYPGDPSGSAAEIINCRCVELAMRAKGKNFDLAFYTQVQFYSYAQLQKSQSGSEDNNGD